MKLKVRIIIVAAVAGCLFSGLSAQAHPATGIVVDRNGNVYFSDLETVWKLDAKGTKSVFRAGVNGRHVHELSIDEEGNIYGSDISYNPATKGWPSSVWKMTPDGKLTYLLETTEHPPRGMSIWRDRAGNMYFIVPAGRTAVQPRVTRLPHDRRNPTR